MPEVQVAVGLRRKPRNNLSNPARSQIILNNVAKEVTGGGGGGRLRGHEVGLLVQVFMPSSRTGKSSLTVFQTIPRSQRLRFPVYFVSKLRADTIKCDQIHTYSRQLFQLPLGPRKIEKRHASYLSVNNDIKITPLGVAISGGRSKNTWVTQRKRFKNLKYSFSMPQKRVRWFHGLSIV